jgi:hypothetical protein
MKTQHAISNVDHPVTSRKKNHNSHFTNSQTILKRSNVMNAATSFLSKSLVTFAILVLSAGLVFGQGNYTQTGTITNTGGTLVIKGTADFGAQTTVGGTVDYARTTTSQTIASVSYATLKLTGTGTPGATTRVFPNASVGVSGDLTLASITKADVNARPGTSAVIDYNGGAQAVAAIDYQGLTFSAAGTKTFAAGTTKIAGSFTLTAGTADASSNATTLEYDGTGAQTLAAINYDNLSITGTRSGTPAITLASGTIGVKSAFTVSPSGAVTYVTTGNTVDYNGTLAQTITAFNYNDLTISAARGVNNITLASSGTIGVAAVFNPTATFTSGVYVVTGSTINYTGTTGQSIVGGATFSSYNNLTISGSGTKAASGDIALIAAGVLNNSVTFDMSTNTLAFTAAPTNTGTVQFAGAANGRAVGSASGTVEYNGTVAQAVSAANPYYNLMITNPSGTAAKTIAGAVQAANDLTVNASSFLTVSGSAQVDHDLVNTGTITNSGTITVGL